MQIITKSGTRLLNFMPRETIDSGKVYELKIKSEEQNKIILTDSNASFTLVKYYYTYSTTQALTEAEVGVSPPHSQCPQSSTLSAPASIAIATSTGVLTQISNFIF